VAYGSDVDRVREVLLEAARSVEYVVEDPAPRVRFTEMGDSALIFRLLCWINDPVLRGRCVDGLNTAVYKALNAEGIEIPFPQRDLHLRQPLPSSFSD
jgi:small-conductance mechanosensitive channel